MTTTFPTTTTAPATPALDRPNLRHAGMAGIAAAVLGVAGTLFLDTMVDEDVAAAGGSALVQALDDGKTALQISCGIGLLSVVALLVFATGLQRRFEARGVAGTTAARVLDRSLTASAGAMFIGFGARAIMAGSLPSGVDGAFYSDTGREAIYATLNNFPYMAWMGVAFAAGAAAVLGFKHGALSKPVAAMGALAAVVVTAMTLGFGLPYSSSLVGPLFLLVAAVSMVRDR